MKNTATLLINCPDRKGIVATVAIFLYKHNANILHADEHQDSEKKLFFLRTEWELSDFTLNKEKFERLFFPIAVEFKMEWKVVYSSEKLKVAIFVSREEHCLSDLLFRHKNNELDCSISLIVSNHPYAKALADFYGIPFYEIEVNIENKINAEQKMLKILQKNNVELVILARYMQILSKQFIHNFNHPIINIHHSFLPAFVGAKPYHQAYKRGVKIIGTTAHYITSDLDQGPIIEQDILRVSHRDSVCDLVQKGRDIEKIVLSRAVKWHIENRILTYGNKTVVFD
jgi:formyltetrahydrofolate deformylase